MARTHSDQIAAMLTDKNPSRERRVRKETKRKEQGKKATKEAEKARQAWQHPEIVRLVSFARHGIEFAELCNKMNMSPRACDRLIKRAEAQHAPIHVEHNHVTISRPSPALEKIQEIHISRPIGKPYLVGAISDTHAGSKYCLRGALRETIDWMYEQGVRDILHSGDVLEGCYRHAQYELSHRGFDDQLREASKLFPIHKGLRYHGISGNHDFTFEEQIGMRIGVAIEQGMRAWGRTDWKMYGDRNAFVKLGGAIINAWHPRGAPAYARSYVLQKRIEAYTAIKPHIVQMGHYHQFCHVYERGIHGIMMPCFQGSGSNFAQSLRGPPSIGGIIFRWRLSETGRIHDFDLHPRFFYEKDTIFDAYNELDAEPLHPVGRDRRYR